MHVSPAVREWIGMHPRVFRSYRTFSLYRQRKFRTITAPLRKLPDFIIIGAAKSGTTSLYDFIAKHPDISSSYVKEPSYFSTIDIPGLSYYRTNFPIHTRRLTGEASTSYFARPDVPERIKSIIPDAKLIVLLRNPVDRAYSHYHFARKRNVEPCETFEEALEQEKARREKYLNSVSELKSILDGKANVSKERNMYNIVRDCWDDSWHSYLRYGHYAEHLENWIKHFKRDRFLILSTDEFRDDRQHALDGVFEFLDVDSFVIHDFKDLNVGRYKGMKAGTRRRLLDYFRPHNEQLYDMLDRRFNWDG